MQLASDPAGPRPGLGRTHEPATQADRQPLPEDPEGEPVRVSGDGLGRRAAQPWELTEPHGPDAPQFPERREALGARLRAEREARGWTPRRLAEKFSAASHGRHAVPDVESMIPQIRRWERGGSGVGEHYRTLYCVVLGVGPGLFPAARAGQEVKADD
jgi:hypothetical protein